MATLNFKGKSFVQNHHLAVKYHQLIPKKEKSLTDKVSLNDNLIIHGDNLKALKALLPSYAGKIKCIYIDPPYNTGNEGWKYNDNVNSPMMQEWLGKIVDQDDFTRHDKWLCMMMPRLKLLRELMSNDGVLFISIDDNENHNLISEVDEIFGENHRLGTITWIKRTKPVNSGKARFQLQQKCEYVLCYSKKPKEEFKGFNLKTKGERKYTFDGKYGKCRLTDIEDSDYGRKARDTMKFPILGILPDEGKRWKIGKDEVETLITNDRIIAIGGKIKRVIYPEDEEPDYYKPFWSHFDISESGTAENGKAIVSEILGKDHGMDTVKPVNLLRELIYAVTDKHDIILDSFAGTGTTAHAVLDLNKEDDGNRKFILVECEDYADEITAERVRRVIKGVPDAKDEKLTKGLGGSFSYFELGDPIEMQSILEGKNLPSYIDLARYVFYTATGEEFLPDKINETKHFIGQSRDYEVYLFYKPDLDYLKSTALTLDLAKSLGKNKAKKKLVFAPAKYLDLNDSELLSKHGLKDIEYSQLPFEIYKLRD